MFFFQALMSVPLASGIQYEREIRDELISMGYTVREVCAGPTHAADVTVILNDSHVNIECKTKLQGTDYKQCIYKLINDDIAVPSSKNKNVNAFFNKHAPNIKITRDSQNHLQDIHIPCNITTCEEILDNTDYIFIKDTGRYRVRENDPLNLGLPILYIKEAEIRIREKNHGKNSKGIPQKDITAALRIKSLTTAPSHIVIYPATPISVCTTILNKPMRSCLRYPGGKTRAIKIILPLIKERFGDINKLCSPFCGGCSIEFALNPQNVIINDRFEPLYNFWCQVRDNKQPLIDTVKGYKNSGVSKDTFIRMRTAVMDTSLNSIERAAMYFIINRCSFSGATLSGGYSSKAATDRFTDSAIDAISKINISRYTITNNDFTVCIKETPDDYFIFADPPYYLESGSKLYGKNGDLHENFNHQSFANTLKSFKGKWLLTYNDCPFIRELYKDCEIIPAEWSYGMNQSKESSEVIILPIR